MRTPGLTNAAGMRNTRYYNIDMPDKELPVQCRVTRARPAVPAKPG